MMTGGDDRKALGAQEELTAAEAGPVHSSADTTPIFRALLTSCMHDHAPNVGCQRAVTDAAHRQLTSIGSSIGPDYASGNGSGTCVICSCVV